jgi:putative transcriptional regulator
MTRGRVRNGFCLDLKGPLCALLLLVGPFPWTFADDSKPLNSILIVARAELPDPHFADSVVLVMNNLAPGPIGIIINRPTEIPVSHLFPDLKRLAQLHDKLYFGGPVDLESVWFLFRATSPSDHAMKACEGVYLSADKDLLLKLLARNRPMDGVRIFLGHSGWAPGQLEAEIDRGDWTARPADSDAIFKGQAEHPWPSPEGQAGHNT